LPKLGSSGVLSEFHSGLLHQGLVFSKHEVVEKPSFEGEEIHLEAPDEEETEGEEG
jgi:hypothetical protein